MINAAWHKRHPMPRNPIVEERIAWHLEHQKQCACRPIPAKLQALMGSRSSAEGSLRSLLSGGDRRSVAGSRRARALVEADPQRVAELAALAQDDDWLVSMRAMDLLEKLADARAKARHRDPPTQPRASAEARPSVGARQPGNLRARKR